MFDTIKSSFIYKYEKIRFVEHFIRAKSQRGMKGQITVKGQNTIYIPNKNLVLMIS